MKGVMRAPTEQQQQKMGETTQTCESDTRGVRSKERIPQATQAKGTLKACVHVNGGQTDGDSPTATWATRIRRGRFSTKGRNLDRPEGASPMMRLLTEACLSRRMHPGGSRGRGPPGQVRSGEPGGLGRRAGSPEQLALGPDDLPGCGREAPTRAPTASREGSEESVSAFLRAPGEPRPHGGLNKPGKVAPANPPGFLSLVKTDSESSRAASLISIASPPRPLPPAAPCDTGTVSTSRMNTGQRQATPPGTAKPRGEDRRPSPSSGRGSRQDRVLSRHLLPCIHPLPRALLRG